jgi:hypothetical protein
MAAGLGFKTFTTGEVLTAADTNGYLMQGVLVFASAAARNAAITSPQEGQFAYTKDTNGLWYYDGAAWVASGATGDIEGVTAGVGISGGGTSGTVTITNSMATEITAKGDLIAGTGSATFDNLAVGTNGQTLVADSTAATGLKWATPGGSSYTWTSYTPTISSQSGSITTYTSTGKYLTLDKAIFFIFNVTLTTVGTATGNLNVTLPFTSVGSSVGSVFESNNFGTSGTVAISGNSSIGFTRNYAGTTWFTNGVVLVGSIFYEVA